MTDRQSIDEAEETLIRRCQTGDRDAFGVLVKRHAGSAIGAAFVLMRNHADALDASQEAFIRAWRNIRRFRGKARFYTWYSVILRNVCAGLLRRRARRRTVELTDRHARSDPRSDPVLLAETGERTRRLWQAVLELPVKHREVILMNHLQEMSYRQIAESLGLPVGTVMSRLHNARRALREKLAGDRP